MSSKISELAIELKKLQKPGKRTKYPKELKRKVIELLNSGFSVKELSTGLNIHATTLIGWKSKARLQLQRSFHQAELVNDNPDIKVTVISGLKLSDLNKFF